MKPGERNLGLIGEYKKLLKRKESKKATCEEAGVPYLLLDSYYCCKTEYLGAILMAEILEPSNLTAFYKENLREYNFISARSAAFSSTLYLKNAKYCVCLNCAKTFDPKMTGLRILQNSIVFPFCNHLSVITDNQGIEINDDLFIKVVYIFEDDDENLPS